MTPSSFVSLVVLAAAAIQQPPAPPRTAPRLDAGVASISGRVTDKATGQALPGILVQISDVLISQPRVIVAVTGADGRYELDDLRPSRYFMWARDGEAAPLYQPKALEDRLTLTPGEKRTGVDFALERGYAVVGRVTNEAAEPLAGLAVRAERIDRSGRPFSPPSPPVTTDERGYFRLYGLALGRWRVCANPSGRLAAAGGKLPSKLVRTCVPHDSGLEGTIVIRDGDVTDISIRMRRERAYTASGIVVNENGARVDHASVEVRRVERDSFRFEPSIAKVSDGTFVADGLTPGEYIVRASGTPALQGVASIRVDAMNVSGVVVRISPGADISGRVVFDGEPLPRLEGPMRIAARRGIDATELYRDVDSAVIAFVTRDLTFALTGVRGPIVLDVIDAPAGWVIKSVRHGDAEIAGIPAEFAPARSADVLVVLTNRTARLTVRPVDAEGRPVTALLFIMPVDRLRLPSSATPPLSAVGERASAGASLLPGEYAIVAFSPDDTPRAMRNPDELTALARRAPRVALREGEHRTIDVRVSTPGGPR